jgi:hypothetical protein
MASNTDQQHTSHSQCCVLCVRVQQGGVDSTLKRIQSADNIFKLMDTISPTRCRKLNIQSLQRHGTIEFRHPAGTHVSIQKHPHGLLDAGWCCLARPAPYDLSSHPPSRQTQNAARAAGYVLLYLELVEQSRKVCLQGLPLCNDLEPFNQLLVFFASQPVLLEFLKRRRKECS